jgi:hypothetical protein
LIVGIAMTTVWHLNRDKRAEAYEGDYTNIAFPDDYTMVHEIEHNSLSFIKNSRQSPIMRLGAVVVVDGERYRCGMRSWEKF